MTISSNRLRQSAARRPRYARLRLEACEERAVPASVVNATLAAGTLTLTAVDVASVGAPLPHSRRHAGPDQCRSGRCDYHDFTQGRCTRANVDIPGVKALSINLKGGVDSVVLQGIFLAGNVTIKGTGSDKNWFLSAGTIIGGSVTLTSGDGDDLIEVDGTRIGKGLTVTLGKTNVNNQLSIKNGSFIGQSVKVTGSVGQENVDIQGSTIGGGLTTTLMAGPDAVNVNDTTVGGKSTFSLGNGVNSLNIDGPNVASTTGSFLLGGVSVTGGTEADTVNFGSSKPVLVGGPVSMTLGSEATGNGDTVSIDDTTFLDAVRIDFGAGKGADTLSIETLAGTATKVTNFFDKFTVTMGLDNDRVVLGTNGVLDQQVMFSVAPSIDGGKSLLDNDSITRGNGQIDSLPFDNNNTFFKNFETIV